MACRAAITLMLLLAGFGGASAREPQYLSASMPSPLLTAFWGRAISVDAHILLPDSYYKEPQKRYPVFYWIQGFDGRGQIGYAGEAQWQEPMRRLHREFIVVFLDGMFNGGHQEFADSANNGPWGAALTTEFIPEIDSNLRAIGTANPLRRRSFIRRMVGSLAADNVPRHIWRRVVHFTRPGRLSRFHRTRYHCDAAAEFFQRRGRTRV